METSGNVCGGQIPPQFGERQCGWILQTAYRDACSRGLSREEAEDGSINCLIHLFECAQAGILPTPLHEGYLRRCVQNWIRNTVRDVSRHRAHEQALSSCEYMEIQTVRQRLDVTMTPEQHLFRPELTDRVLLAGNRLTFSQARLFAAFFLENQGIDEIATSTGRTPHAIRQALFTLRRRIRTLLAEEGLTLVEIAEYHRLSR